MIASESPYVSQSQNEFLMTRLKGDNTKRLAQLKAIKCVRFLIICFLLWRGDFCDGQAKGKRKQTVFVAAFGVDVKGMNFLF